MKSFTLDFLAYSDYPGVRFVCNWMDTYNAIIDTDFPELGYLFRRPEILRRWPEAYASATATTASYETIRDAASSEQRDKPSKSTTQPCRDILERLWIVDPVPAWLPPPEIA